MIKNVFLKKSIKLIQRYHLNYNKEQEQFIRYGLEAIYLSLIKLIPILFFAFVLGLFKESILFLVFYTLLRFFGFGLHSNNGYICFISSAIVFLLLPYLSKIIEINLYLKVFITIFCFFCFLLYSPADTKKRPIINKKKDCLLKLYLHLF